MWGLWAHSLPLVTACWQELFCSQASVTLFGTVTHGWRTHTLTTADLVTRMGPGGVTSPSMCSDVTYVWLHSFVPLYFWLWFAASLSYSRHLPGFVRHFERFLQGVQRWWETGTGHWGRSVLSIFRNLCIFKPLTSFWGIWGMSSRTGSVSRELLSVFPLRVYIPVFLNFRTIWWGRRDVTADRIKVRAYPGALFEKQWMWVHDWLERVGFGDACGRDM